MRKKGQLHLLSVALMLLFCLAACQNDSGLKQNKDGAWEIHTAEDLILMTAKAGEGESFLLMRDIDMNGAEWTPVEDFKGVFDGQGYTISNLTITKSSADGSMGFFCAISPSQKEDGTTTTSTVKNLRLENVDIVATADAQHIGLLAGRVNGKVENCTTVGAVTDNRTRLSLPVYAGTIAGVIERGEITYTADYAGYLVASAGTACETDEVNGLSSKMARFFAKLEEGSETRTIGVAGLVMDGKVDTTAKWQDTTNSTSYVSDVLQQRRKTVVDYMYQMATVKWTPSTNMVWYSYKSGGHTTPRWNKGTVYCGIPYNHGSSSFERFLSVMDGTDSNGVYVTSTTLPANGFYFTDSKVISEVNAALKQGETVTASGYIVPDNVDGEVTNSGQAGFALYIGTDCSTSISQAWRRVSAVSGTDKCRANSGNHMIPTSYNINTYSIVPVDGVVMKAPLSYTKNEHKYAIFEQRFNEDNNAYYETMALASMGDALVGYSQTSGHTRLVAGDAVVIRDYEGIILPFESYIVTHEQGRPSTIDGYKSEWTVNFKYTFDMLTNPTRPEYLDENGKSMIGVRAIYIPVTIKALRVEDTPAAQPYVEMKNGSVRSNFNIISTTLGTETVYTGIVLSGHRGDFNAVDLTKTHKDIKKGDTVKVLLSNGEIFEVVYE